jgi:hypothetical protein
MDINPPRDIREGNNIDVITRVRLRGFHSWGFDEARESFAVAVDAGIDPVADGDGGAGVGKWGVDGGAWMRGYEGEEEGEEEGWGGRHCGGCEGWLKVVVVRGNEWKCAGQSINPGQ